MGWVISQAHSMSSVVILKACERITLHLSYAPVPCLPHDSYNKGLSRRVSHRLGSGTHTTPAGNRRWVSLGAPSRDTGRIRPALAVSTVESGKHLDAFAETRERATAGDGLS